MLIRRAEISDIPEILRLLHQVCDVHAQIRPDIFKSGGTKYNEAELQKILADDALPVFCALEGGRFLGYCFCKWKELRGSSVMVDCKELYIDDLCVDESARGQGVATELFRFVKGYARAGGSGVLTLNVWLGNDNALRFYEKMGMTPRNTILELALEEDYAD